MKLTKLHLLFTSRRYAYARTLLSAGIRPSVRPSVCLSRSCIISKRIKRQTFFLGMIAPYHSSFLIPSGVIQFQGEPTQWGVKYRAWGKLNAIFDINRHLYRKRYEIGSLLL